MGNEYHKVPTDDEVKAAKDTLWRAYYWGPVADYAEDFAKRIQAGEFADYEAFDETFREEIDGSYWTIYTHANWLVVFASDSTDEAKDELAEIGIEAPEVNQWAYQCLLIDVRERLERELGESIHDAIEASHAKEEEEEEDATDASE